MLNPAKRPPRPRLTGRIAAYALIDVFGLTCVAIGGSWFAANQKLVLLGGGALLVMALAAAFLFWPEPALPPPPPAGTAFLP